MLKYESTRVCMCVFVCVCVQLQDRFCLDLSDEAAVHYMQNIIDISLTATMAAIMEQMHKLAQVRRQNLLLLNCCLVRFRYVLIKRLFVHVRIVMCFVVFEKVIDSHQKTEINHCADSCSVARYMHLRTALLLVTFI